ncbi:ketoacyl-ACP synthase III family protein [Pendulispora rubella]|uniref:Ketoacyl-ACP synthase III family protein n=1 Tax=Pendulispora rubella TaxID=2741070 RepID=A0ABZ2L253_9BACT
MTPTSLFIAGLASYIPARVMTSYAAERGWCDADAVTHDGWWSAAVAGDMAPVEMALHASQSAMRRSGCSPADIDILFYASVLPQGPHMWCPQHYVERRVVGRDIPAIELRQGCNGLLNAFDLAASYLAAPGRRAALVTGADNFGCDPAFGVDPSFRWRYAENIHGRKAGSILGDSGGAAVLSNQGGFARVLGISSRSVTDMEELFRSDEPLFPPSYRRERPTRLGARFNEHERRHPGRVSEALTCLKRARTDLALDVLAEAKVEPHQITRVAHVFAATERYAEQLLGPLGIDPARGVVDFGRGLGHLGVNDQLTALEHLMTSGQLGRGDHVLMMSNGIGSSLTCAVLEILERPSWEA